MELLTAATAKGLMSLGEKLISRIWPDPEKQAEELRKLKELEQSGDLEALRLNIQLMLGQIEINKTEAQHKSVFVAGWRPAVGWVCVSVLAFNYIGVYLLEYVSMFVDGMPEAPKRFDMSDLWPVLLGMLGIGGMRSWDKSRGVQTDSISSR